MDLLYENMHIGLSKNDFILIAVWKRYVFLKVSLELTQIFEQYCLNYSHTAKLNVIDAALPLLLLKLQRKKETSERDRNENTT